MHERSLGPQIHQRSRSLLLPVIAFTVAMLYSGTTLAIEPVIFEDDRIDANFAIDSLHFGSAVALGRFTGDPEVVMVSAPGDLFSGGGSIYEFFWTGVTGWSISNQWQGLADEYIALDADGFDGAIAILSKGGDGEVWEAPGKAGAGKIIDGIAGIPRAVAVALGKIAVGRPDYGLGAGRVRIYEYNVEFDLWQPSDPIDGGLGDRLGTSLDFGPDGNVLAIGAPGAGTWGEVEIYLESPGGWNLLQTVTPPLVLGADARFGEAVALVENWLVVGAPGADLLATDHGAVFFYRPEFLHYENVSGKVGPMAGDRLGASLAAGKNGSALLVTAGAPQNGASLSTPGEGYVQLFHADVDADRWEAFGTLHDSQGASGDGFGTALATDGHRVVVGAPYADVPGYVEAGSVLDFHDVGSLIFEDGFESGDLTAWSGAN